jgi:2-polyprenyl-3-methyl-5-hydroxy-6-metoxy-1,4-benzoquinol methylase
MSIGEMKMGDVAESWIKELEESGYKFMCKNYNEYRRLKNFGYVSIPIIMPAWKMILKRIRLKKGAEILEVGCGGGRNLIPLALNGYKTTGIDCSKEVLHRCKDFIKSVETFHGGKLDAKLINADFNFLLLRKMYDMVFSIGVVEHFLEYKERIVMLKKFHEMVKTGGWLITIVPNGIYPKRREMKEKRLGGYKIPEIDYTSKKLQNELEIAGFSTTEVVPWNPFGYLSPFAKNLLTKGFALSIEGLFRVTQNFLPLKLREKYSYSLIAISLKKTKALRCRNNTSESKGD